MYSWYHKFTFEENHLISDLCWIKHRLIHLLTLIISAFSLDLLQFHMRQFQDKICADLPFSLLTPREKGRTVNSHIDPIVLPLHVSWWNQQQCKNKKKLRKRTICEIILREKKKLQITPYKRRWMDVMVTIKARKVGMGVVVGSRFGSIGI